ncbi:MAG: RHS repeat-associated core domain-containing protein [Saprospiraceae bacterium]|nr:RHS repeat-associated core domain-containing protein [Candidatus Defluviibacterium haderslevense]MBK7243845.1 RHS repeat-associated core domain-containing protein [Candidatus Defluviibacterium haderslevense]
MKGLGQYPLAALNGLSLTAATIGNYSQYVSGYMVMGPHYMVTNHYYSGTERIACKLVGSVESRVDNSLELTGTEKAGLPDRQAEDLELVRTEFGFDTLVIEDTDPEEDDCEGNNDCPNVLYFFHPDHIGSSTFLTDEAGNPYQFLLYLPFGESMAEQKAGGYSTKYRFTGKEVDEETGLYYFGARYYDPRISLWYGVDPMTEKAPNWNPYRYGFNNPIRMIDPDGKFETEDEAKAFAKDNGIKTGWFRDHKIKKQDDGTYSINKGGHMAYYYGSGAADPSEYSDNGGSNKLGNWFSKIFGSFNRKSGTAFESNDGEFGAKEHSNVDYGEKIDGIIKAADAMKSVQGVSNPLGEPKNDHDAIKQLGEILDWGTDAGSILYNVLPSLNKSNSKNPNKWGPIGGNDTFESNFGYMLHDPKLPGTIVRYDSGGIHVPYWPKK